jgi:penicillin-insensitive murein endopeptidase
MRGPFLPGLRCLSLAAFLAANLATAATLPGNGWSAIQNPSPGPVQVIGGTANGCIAGASNLPIDGPGYEVIKLSRRRYFGHGDTVDLVQGLGRRAPAAGQPIF